MKRRLDLSDIPWTIEPIDGAIPDAARRSFPYDPRTCAHTPLIDAGVIPHPDHGDGESDQRWIGRSDWRATTSFDLPDDFRAAGRLDLIFDELDTVATVTLNGVEIGRVANAFRPHRFDIAARAQPHANELIIDFRGPVAWAEAEAGRLGSRPANGDWGPYSHIRTRACSFGWDWGPQTPSVSVGPVRIDAWSRVRIDSVRPLVRSAVPHEAAVDVVVETDRVEHAGDAHLAATLFTPDGAVAATGGAVCDRRTTVIPLTVRQPQRWFPRGVGEQPLYRLYVSLRTNGDWSDQWAARIGLRTVDLELEDGAFMVRVNDAPVFCRGANWIPPALFPGPERAACARALIDEAVEANMNMLRIWGGGRYEDDAFYERCDELGVLVWQDAMLACATYPEDDPFPAELAAELHDAMRRLARHPSIVVWCGGNENILAYQTWGWRDEMPADQAWGRRYFLEDFPAIAATTDPTRPFWPDSPYSGDEATNPNDPERGDRHTWDRRYDEFRQDLTRFASEFGCQGPPARRTLIDAASEDALRLESPALAHRQRGWGGDDHQYRELPAIFGPAPDFETWHAHAQLFQARTLWMACGRYRMLQPDCMGALVWQLNDVWTGHTWSLIDVAGRRKPAWWAVRRAFAPRAAFWRVDDDGLRAVLVNDTLSGWRTGVRIRRLDVHTGEAIYDERSDVVAPTGRATVAGSLLAPPGDPTRVLDVLDAGDARDVYAWAPDHAIDALPPAIDVAVDGAATTLTARTVVRDLLLPADAACGDVSVTNAIPQWVTLLPEETLRIAGAPHEVVAASVSLSPLIPTPR